MEPILITTGFLLYNHYKQRKNNANEVLGTLPSGKVPWVYPDDDSGQVTRKPEYATVEPPVGYKPGWMRQFDGYAPKETTEVKHPSDEDNSTLVNPYNKFRSNMGDAARQVIGTKTSGEGVWENEPIKERPPHFGGYDNYDEERGRKPIPRYFRFDLGEDHTGDQMKDSGMLRGLGYKKQSMSNSYEIQPDKDIQLAANHRGYAPGRLLPGVGIYDQERPQTETLGVGRGIGHVRERQYLPAQNDPLDRRFLGEHVAIHNVTPGTSKVGRVFQGDPMLDKNITRHSQIPATDMEKPYSRSRGVASNPITKKNYQGKATDYLQQPQPKPIKTTGAASGVSRFTKLHSTSNTVTKDATNWTYTVGINDSKALIDATLENRKLRANQQVPSARQEGVSADRQLGRIDLNNMDRAGMDRQNRGILPLHSTVGSEYVNSALSSDKQLEHIPLDTLNPKMERSNIRPVLFSEEERNDYKLDAPLRLESGLEAPSQSTQGLGAHIGASTHKPMSVQYDVTDKNTVNNTVKKRSTHEVSALNQGGSEKRDLHDFKVQTTFEQDHTVVTNPRMLSIYDQTLKSSMGVAKDGINQHPFANSETLTIPSLSNDKRDAITTFGTGKKSVKPEDNISTRFNHIASNNTAQLFQNDLILERGANITLPGTAGRPTRGHAALDPGRESLSEKPGRLKKRR